MSIESGIHGKGTFLLQDAIRSMKSKGNFRKAGVIVTFIGIVRGETAKGEKVEKLMLEAYEEKANEALAEICSDLRTKRGIVDVQIHHLLGEFSVGEDIVYVLVAGSHREKALAVLKKAVERYKEEVPIFKKEHIVTKKGHKDSYWVSERKRST